MVLKSLICLTPCEDIETTECTRCKMAHLLYCEMMDSPVLKCFFEKNIHLEMDNLGNSTIVGFSDDPNLLLAAVIQTDAYQIGCETFSEFQLEIKSSNKEENKYTIYCQIIPIKLKEEKKSCSN